MIHVEFCLIFPARTLFLSNTLIFSGIDKFVILVKIIYLYLKLEVLSSRTKRDLEVFKSTNNSKYHQQWENTFLNKKKDMFLFCGYNEHAAG